MQKRYLEVQGSFYDMAYQQGEFFRNDLEKVFRSIQHGPFLTPWLQRVVPSMVYRIFLKVAGQKYLKSHRKLLSQYHEKNIVDALQGLADGFQSSLNFIYGFCALEVISSCLPYALGCTSLIFPKELTESNTPLIAYNHDFPGIFGPFLLVRKNRPHGGPTSLSVTYPTILGAIAGINEHGLAVSLNHAYEMKVCSKKALLVTLLVQECLNRCATVEEVEKLILSTPVTNGSMITVLDKNNNRAVFELSSQKNMKRSSHETILHTFNKYQIPQMEELEIPLDARGKGHFKGYKIHVHNIGRQSRYDQLIDPSKKYSESGIHQLLSDHRGGVGDIDTLCRHHHTSDTLASMILNPQKRELKIIFGFPCQGEYQSYKLFLNSPLYRRF